MLKIKDNIPLKELEKFGFYKEKDYITNKEYAYKKHSTRINFRDRHFSKTDAHFGEYDLEILYDLIKANLVEKMED